MARRTALAARTSENVHEQTNGNATVGSSDPIQPIRVKTITYRAVILPTHSGSDRPMAHAAPVTAETLSRVGAPILVNHERLVRSMSAMSEPGKQKEAR